MPSTSSDPAGRPGPAGRGPASVRACRILVTAAGRIPSVELGAILPLRELMRRGRCRFVYSDEPRVTADHIAWADVVFFVRACSARARTIADAARAARRKLMAYYDDDFLSLPEGSPSQAYYGSRGIRELLLWFLHEMDLLCFCNPDLAQRYGGVGGRPVAVLAVGIDIPDATARPHQTVTRVLFAGSTDHAGFVDRICGGSLRALGVEQLRELEIHCIGARPKFIDELPVEYSPYLSDYSDYRAFVRTVAPDICLAPLPEGEFYARKYHNKLLDYGSLGAAIIFSDVPPYRGIVVPGETGLLVPNTPEAWREALLSLLQEAGLRNRLAEGAREYVRVHHSLGGAGDSYAESLASFLNYRAPEVPVEACHIAARGLLFEYLGEHGVRRTLRQGMRRFLGI